MLIKLNAQIPELPSWPAVCKCEIEIPGEKKNESQRVHPIVFLKSTPILFARGYKYLAIGVCDNCGTAFVAEIDGENGYKLLPPEAVKALQDPEYAKQIETDAKNTADGFDQVQPEEIEAK